MGLLEKLWRGRRRRRVCVLGLDGVPVGLLRELAARGQMPCAQELLQSGTLVPMLSTLPTISSVSWTSFITGANPGRHGVYGFTDLKPGSYDVYFPDFREVKSPTLWDLLGKEGRTSFVLNIPGTYPARELRGMMVSGFVAVNLARAVHPPSILPTLQGLGYRIDVDYARAAEEPEIFFADLERTLAARRQAFLHFLRQPDWDLFIGVVTETDRLHHYFWDDYVDPTAPRHAAFLEHYRQVDALVGEVAAEAERVGAELLVVSDHGHCRIEQEVYPNAWLRDEGYLRFRSPVPKSVADLDPASRAFVLDPGRIYLNVRGRYPGGCVEEGQVEGLRLELAERLRNLTDPASGERLVGEVWTKEQLYAGPQVSRAPDLVLQCRNGFDIKGAVARQNLVGKMKLTGMHTYDDSVFYVRGRSVAPGDVRIVDIAPTILGMLGVDTPPTMDGRPQVLAA